MDSVAQIECLAEAIFSEARGESIEGQFAVGSVIKNRVYHDHYPDTYCDVINQENQFTYHFDGVAWKKEVEARRRAKSIAALVYNSPVSFIDREVLYFTHKDVNYFNRADGIELHMKIGNHNFYSTSR